MTNMDNNNVTCILCEREVPVSQSIEDCATGKPLCADCVNTEYEEAQAA
jgi:hypothetical protein